MRIAPGFIFAISRAPIMPCVARRLRHVQAHHVGLGQQLVEGVGGLDVAVAQLVGVVVVDHAHAHGLGQHGELGADVAVADDAERLAAHLVGADRALVPAAARAPTVDLGKMRRISMTISAIVSSATERVLENGALKTGMPMARQAARSTWLVPTEKQPIATSDLMPSIASAVIWVRERMPSRRTPSEGLAQLRAVEGLGAPVDLGVAGGPAARRRPSRRCPRAAGS